MKGEFLNNWKFPLNIFFLVGYLLYSIVPSLNMNQSQVYTCSLPPEPPLPSPTPSSSHPSRLSQNPGLSSLCHTADSSLLFHGW